MKKLMLISLTAMFAGVGMANAAVDLSPSAPDAKIATSKQYVDSGLSKKANKTDLQALDTALGQIETDLDDMATQTWVSGQLGGINLNGKQDQITCTSGVMVFTGAGTYECQSLAAGEYTGD